MDIRNLNAVELKDYAATCKVDITVIEETFINNKEKYAGCESGSNEEETLKRTVNYIKETYGTEVEPTISGMEGFVDTMKKGLKAVVEAIKGKPNKKALAAIKTHIGETDKAVELYKSNRWQADQTFINIGFSKFQTPGVFNELKTADEYKKVIKDILDKCKNDYSGIIKNAERRLGTGLKIFNQFKNKQYNEEDVEKVKKLYPIKPAIMPVNKEAYLSLIGNEYVHNSVPVLTKDQVKEIADLMKTVSLFVWGLATERENLVDIALDWSDIMDSDFWMNVSDDVVKELALAAEWGDIDNKQLDPFTDPVEKIMLEILKFLENWILYSVK
ncbi:hypothetical protein [Aeromonas phage AerS_266]|nr:hypothetical protein [Aeromonas phage AerS_266]